MRYRLALVGSVLLASVGCRTWALPGDVAWSVEVITPKVSRGGDLAFRVDAKGKGGATVDGIAYVYVVDWVGIKGMRHKGTTGERSQIRAKGGDGKGELRIYTYDAAETLVEVARASFTVE